MATVTVVNAERTLEIEATSIVSGLVNEAGHLILTRHDGTDLDMGAVSGMQLDNGTAYSKVDAFTYVGDTDPGAVPDGSVWLDTNDVAGPFASDTQKGLVELATNAETISGTDNTRAVTPASLAAIPGNKVQTLAANAVTETAAPTAYPWGISIMSLTTSSGWSLNTGFGSVMTLKSETDRTVQFFYTNPGGSGSPRQWQRQYHTSNNGGGWTAWSQVQTVYNLTPGSIVQSAAATAYPTGWSRMYLSSANGTGWDFAGTAGELMTFVDGTDYGKQTWTSHASGSGFLPEIWTRTYKQSAGWSAWRKETHDNGAWIPYTPSWTSQGSAQPSLGNAVVKCKYSKVGRQVTVHFQITFGTTTNFGTNPTSTDNWIFGLPVAGVDNGEDGMGYLEMYKSATECGWARVKMYTTTGFKLGISPGSNSGIGGDVDSISPFTWASGNSIRGIFVYESAA